MKNRYILIIGIILGAISWAVCPLVSDRFEPFDSDKGFILGQLILLSGTFCLGFMYGLKKVFLLILGIYIGQNTYVYIFGGSESRAWFFLGLVTTIFLCIIPLFSGVVGAVIRIFVNKIQQERGRMAIVARTMGVAKKRLSIVASTISVVIAVLLIDGYVLGPMNFRRVTSGKWPILTYDRAHDGRGNWHSGITYTITTAPYLFTLDSWMPFVCVGDTKSTEYLKAYAQGVEEAKAEISSNSPTMYASGTHPVPVPKDLKDDETGFPIKFIAGCIVTDDDMGRQEGHNKTILEHVKKDVPQ